MVKKKLLFILGFVSLALGIVGIIVPLLPTTPFLLLSAYCFNHSSEKFHNYILNNKIFVQYIRDYNEKKGITLKNKITAISLLILSIGFSMYKLNHLHIRIMLVVVFIGVSFHILKLKTLR